MTYKNKTKKELIEELEALQDELKRLRDSSKTTPSGSDLPPGPEELNEFNSGSFAEFAGGILDCVPANIALIDSSGKIIAVNGSWKKFALDNNSPVNDYYLGVNYLQVCDNAEGNNTAEAMSAARGIRNILKGQSSSFSLEYPCHSEKEKRWFRLYVTPFALKGEQCAVVMHINITETVRFEGAIAETELNKPEAAKGDNEHLLFRLNEEAIAKSNALLKAEEEIHKLSLAVEQSPVIVLITDKEGVIEYVNPRFTEVTGYTFDEAIGEKPSIIKSNLTPLNQYMELWGRLKKGEHWIGEFRNRKKNGELFWELASIFPLKNSLGEITQFVAVKEDITERKRTELRLAEYRDHLEQLVEQRTESLSKVNQLLSVQIEKQKAAEGRIQNQLQFMETLVSTIPNPLLIKDKEGRVINCNKAYEKYFGTTLSDVKGKKAKEIVPAPILDKILEIEKALFASPGHVSVELTRTLENGESFAILVNEATYLEADNSIGGTVALMIDITEQKKLQEKMQTALRKEQELNELKSSFISMASHEFRTPLTSILASADLLEMFGRQWKEEKYLEHIGKIQKGVDYMKELLDDVLVISRNEEGKTQFTPSKTNFLELCSEIFDSVRIASTGSHKFIFNYKPEQKLFVIDPKLIRHIISNLLSNAVKYSPAGGNIILNVKTENDRILFDVIDEGIGIPEVDKDRLFEPFYRAGNTAAIHGTGLGMSIVKRSVELHGGMIAIDSEENKGTAVHVSLPYKS